MSLINALRAQYPEYEKYSDEEITSFISGSTAQIEQEAPIPVGESNDRSWGEAFSDTGVSIMGGFANLGGDLGYLADKATGGVVDVGFLKSADRAADYWQAQKSTFLQNAYSELGAADGFIETLAVAADNPEIVPDLIAGSLPYLAPTGVAAKLAKGAKYATGTVAAVGGLLEGGNAGREAESRVEDMTPEQLAENSQQYRNLIEKGASPKEAKEAIRHKTGLTALAFTAPIAALAGKMTGAAKLEANLFRGAGATGKKSAQFVGAITREGVEEIIQEGSNAFGGNFGVQQHADASQDLGEGVGQSAALGMIAGVGQGAPIAALNAITSPMNEAQNEIEKAGEVAAEAGGDALDQAAARGQTQARATPRAALKGGRLSASDLGITLPDKQDYSGLDQTVTARQASTGRSSDRMDGIDLSGIDGDIFAARRMGFSEDELRLTTAKRFYERAEKRKAAGDIEGANKDIERANAIHQDILGANESIKAESASFPVPYVSQGDILGGEIVPAHPAPTSPVIDGELSPEQLGNLTRRLEDNRGANRLEQSGIIYGEEPAGAAEKRQQREADNFNAFYGQEGQTPSKTEAIEGELDRSRELPNNSFAQLPQGTGQINLGKDNSHREFAPVDPLYENVGENIVQRQIPRNGLPQPSITQEQMIDVQRTYQSAIRIPVAKRSDIQNKSVEIIKAVKAGEMQVSQARKVSKAKIRYSRDPDPMSDDIMNAIALGGGIRRDYAEGVDPQDFSRRAAGIRLVFPKNSGLSLDEMTEYLRQFGYAQTVEELQSKLDSALRGEEVLTPEAQMSKMDELQAELDEQHAPIIEGQTSEESFLSVAAEEARQAGVDEDTIKSIIYDNVDDGELAAAMELSNAIERAQTEGLQAGNGTEGRGQIEEGFPEGESTTAESVWGTEEDLLSSYSEEDLQAREAEQNAERDRQSKADSAAESKAQADAEVNDFALSGSDRDADVAASKGQGDIFSEQKPSAEDEIQSLGDIAKQRRKEDEGRSGFIPPELVSGDMDYLTDIEKQRLHNLKQSLPSHVEQAKAAKERLKERVAARKGDSSERIEDFGEKIGGARKDTATKGIKRGPKADKDKRPGWLKRYVPVEVIAGKEEHKGQWQVIDTRKGKPANRRFFESETDAADAIPLIEVSRNHTVRSRGDDGFAIVRRVSDRKMPVIKDGFETREAAMEYMATNPIEIIEFKTRFEPTIRPEIEGVVRKGGDHLNGAASTPKMFSDTFGFRGVEFGKWNNQSERQMIMDHAYNALVDLSNVLEIEPKALSLNGELAVAFGSRGHGLQGAAAHYERDHAVINLTKLNGAGALAHEWMHAVDHYFGRQDGKASSEKEAGLNGGEVYKARGRGSDFLSHGYSYRSNVRPEVIDAWKSLLTTIFKKSKEYVEDNHQVHKWSKEAEKRLSFQIKSVRDTLSTEYSYGKRFTKPASKEQLAEFDRFVDQLWRGEGMEEKWIPNSGRSTNGRWTSDTLEDISAIYKEVRGRTGFANRGEMVRLQSAYSNYQHSIERAKDAENQVKKTRTIGTDFIYESRRIDEGQAKDYWSTEHEMMARAFEAYIQDQIQEQGNKSGFLVHGASNGYYALYGIKPYPEGSERTAINKSFEKLFNVLEATETDSGVALFSRSGASNSDNASVLGVDAVRASSEAIARRLRIRGVKLSVVASEDSLPDSLKAQIAADGAKGQIKAAYHDKAIHIVADRMASVTDVEEAILHEGAHYGGRALFGKDMHNAYRKLWMKLDGIKGLKAKAKEAGFNMDHYIKTAEMLMVDGEITSADRARFLIDEFLAHLNQQKAHDNLPKRIVRAIQEFMGSIRNMLRKYNLANLDKLTDSDLQYLLKRITQSTQKNDSKADKPHFMRVSEQEEMSMMFSDLAQTLDTPAFSRTAEVADSGIEQSQLDDGFSAPAENMKRQAMSWIADKFHVLKKVQENIEESGKSIDETSDAYLAEELFHGKAENDLRIMKDSLVEPMANKMAELGITQAQLDEYLYAKHAPERNAHIADINPDMPDGGSGMTDQQAADVLSKVKAAGKQEQYDQVASIVYDMLAARRDVIKNGGLEGVEMIDAWESKYEHYVPLKGYAENELDESMPQSGKGFTIGGKESKRAMGRSSEAASPSSYAIQDLTETLIRNRKNEVGNAFLSLVESNPNPEYWEVYTDEKPEMDRRIVKRKDENGDVVEEVVERPVPMAMMQDRYFTTKRDGVTHYIKLEDPRLMKAMKNIGPDTSNFIIQGMAKVSRFLSSVNTSYNPEFVVGNFARDIQTAALNLQAEQSRDDGKAKGEKIAAQTVKDVPVAMRAIYRSLRGKAAKNSTWAKHFDEFREQGAKTGYFDMKDIDGQAEDVKKLVDIAKGGFKGGMYKWARASGQLVEDLNQSVENAVRLSAYVNARKVGISKAKAASLAKNMTVNFNRKGTAGTTLNALYMFANASIQGSMNFARTMGSLNGKKGDPVWSRLNTAQKISVGLMAGSFALATANRMGAGDDDDGENWYDKVPQYVKERNLVIMKSLLGGEQDGSYWKIPLPYGYNIFHVFGTSTEAVASGSVGPGQGAIDLSLAALGSFSPIGFQDSKELSTGVLKNLAPTIAKPIVDVVANENFMGSSIYNENFPFGTPKPDSSLARRSTPEGYRAIASFLNDASGGSQWRSGAIDINPDVMRYFVDYFTGGAGKFVASKFPDNAYRLTNGVELPAHRTVFLSRVNGQVLPYSDQSKFYDRRDEVAQAYEELKGLKGVERSEFRRENRQLLGLRNLIRASEKRLKFLRKKRNGIYSADLSPVLRDERLKTVEQQMKVIVDRFNAAYRKVKN